MASSIDFLMKRLAETPDDWEMRRHIIDVCGEEGDGESAVTLLREAPSLPEKDEDLIACIDVVAAHDGWAALGFAERAVMENGNRGAAHLAKAKACLVVGQLDPARSHYGIAMSHDSSLADKGVEAQLSGNAAPVAAAAAITSTPEAEEYIEEAPVIEEAIEEPIAVEGSMEVMDQIEPVEMGSIEEAAAIETVEAIDEGAPVEMEEPVYTSVEDLSLTSAHDLPVVAPLIDPTAVPEAAVLPVDEVDHAPLTFTAPEELELTRSHLLVASPDGNMQDADALSVSEADEILEENELLVAGEGSVPKIEEKKNDTKAGVSALLITILVHVAIFFLLFLIVLAAPRVFPPEITAITAPGVESERPQKKQVVQQRPETPTMQPSAAVKTMSAAASSPVSVPSIDFDSPDAPVELGTSFASNMGFGASGSMGGGIPFVMKSRCSKAERAKLLVEHGGSSKVSQAVDKSLRWFKENQNEDGSWGADYKGAMTGLALLCYLGNCETPDSPQYGDTVMQGLMYLVELSNKNEGLMADRLDKHYTYEHGIAAYAMGETYALAKYGKRELPGVREAFEQGVNIIIEGQTNKGSWVYDYSGEGSNDTSVHGWQYQALKAAQHTSLKFKNLKGCISDSVDYLETVQGPNGGFGYRGPQDKWSLTGAGVLGLQMLGNSGHKSEIRDGIKYILEGGPGDDTWHGEDQLGWDQAGSNLYAWYYNTQACFQAGGEDWDKWNSIFRDALIDNQQDDGHWGASKGNKYSNDPVYTTALSTLMLEVYYRYLPATGSKSEVSF